MTSKLHTFPDVLSAALPSRRILLSVLNWGLGHASRCIPLIRQLQSNGHEVLLASDGEALLLLKKEFPGLALFNLPGYPVRYRNIPMALNMALALPGIVSAIRKERQLTCRLVREHQIDLLISDNRYGCYHRQDDSIFMTHQLTIKAPWAPAERLIGRFNRYWIAAHFGECWAPDFAEPPGLSGVLSHGNWPEISLRYIGPLSRMRKYAAERKYDVIVVLSGPEPQRTLLEEKIIAQALDLPYRVLLVRGKTGQDKHYFIKDHIEVRSYLTSGDLNDAIMASGVLVARSGYSTIMDLAVLQKPALLIPTPGQTEQEYLAELLQAQGLFHTQQQSEMDLKKGLAIFY